MGGEDCGYWTVDTQLLLTELDASLRNASRTRHLEMLRQMTDLFIANKAKYSAEQVAIFDAVIKRLAQNIGPRAQSELAARLATLDDAPIDTIGQLSSSDDITVSGPILEKSKVLKDSDLVGLAKTKSQGHLLAIASRTQITDSVTDVLVDRGDNAVKRKVISNEGAAISEYGYARLISAASKDKRLAEIVAKREDIPAELQSFLEAALA